MKKLLLTGTILLSVLAVKADNWCTLCVKGQNVEFTKKEKPAPEVPNKPECNCHKDPKFHELFSLLKTASSNTTFGVRTMKEPVQIAFSENGENISYTLDVNNEVTLSSKKEKEPASFSWKVQVNDKTFGATIDNIISILKASDEK